MHEATASKEITSKIEGIAHRVAESEGLEVVEVEVKGGGSSRLVRISIDKPEGVTHADCELVSQQVGTILDVEGVVPGGRYTLEVSSPGVERALNTARDFERFQGKKIKLALREDIEKQHIWVGTLSAWEDGTIVLEAEPGHILRIPYAQVRKANLKFEW